MDPRVVRPPEELDLVSAARLDEELGLCDAEDLCIVDFGDVRFCDSSGVRVLVHHVLRHIEAGGSMRLINVSHTTQRLFRITGVDRLLGTGDQ